MDGQKDRWTDDGKVIPMCPLPTAGDTIKGKVM